MQSTHSRSRITIPTCSLKTPIKFFTGIGAENRSALQTVCVCHGRNVSADTSGEIARSRLIRWMTKLRRSMLFFSLPGLVVYFRCSGAKYAFSRQRLPQILVCDLRDLGEPWDEQIKALITHSEMWRQMDMNYGSWVASDTLKIADIIRSWKHILEKV